MEEFYVLIAGSRHYDNFSEMTSITDFLLYNLSQDAIHIVSGGAKGADALAKRYAEERGCQYHEFPANWNLYGKMAGYRRNKEMHDFLKQFPNRGCICFWDGESKGTQHNFTLCEEYKTPLRIYNFVSGKIYR